MFRTIHNKVVKDNQQEHCYLPWLIEQKSINKELSHCDHTTQEVLTTNSQILKNLQNTNISKDILNKEEGSIIATRTVCSHTLDGLHLSGTHSVQWHGAPLELQRAGGLQFHLWALCIGTRLPGKLWNSVNSVSPVYFLCWRCVPPKVSSDLSASVPSVSPTQCSTLGPISGPWPSQ